MLKKVIFTSIVVGILGVIAIMLLAPSLPMRAYRKVQTTIRSFIPHDPFVPTPVPNTAESTAFKNSLLDSEMVTPTAAPTIKIASPTPTLASPPASFTITSLRHEAQTWNNCGPATTAMLLSAFGRPEKQAQIAHFLKPNYDDKNVSPWEIEKYIREQTDLKVIYRYNGNTTQLKQFVSNGIPVLVETWFDYRPNDGMGHYRLLRGYDDASQRFYFYDSFEGPRTSYTYQKFDSDWKVFNRTYIVAYKPEQERLVKQIVGGAMDDTVMRQASLENAKAEIAKNEKDAYAWFNLGSTFTIEGKHEEATHAYDEARRLSLPWRMLWYQFGIFDSYLAVGRYDDVIKLTSIHIRMTGGLEESFYYRAKAYEATGDIDAAKRDYEKAVSWNKNYTAAAEALQKLQ